MISVCESHAERHHIIFNPTKSKLLCYNVDPSSLGSIYFNNQSIIISHDKHLGNYISTDIQDRNIIANVCDLYQRSNSIITEFHACKGALKRVVQGVQTPSRNFLDLFLETEGKEVERKIKIIKRDVGVNST